LIPSNEMLNKMYVATAALQSVRRPVPEHLEEADIHREIKQLKGFFTDEQAQKFTGGDRGELLTATTILVMNQRLLFNRKLEEITSTSFADGILIGMRAADDDLQSLAVIGMLAVELCGFLEKQHITSEYGLAENLLNLIRDRDSKVYNMMSELASPSAGETPNDLMYVNDPLYLTSEEATEFFVQSHEFDVDFNDFIEMVAAKNSPAQLQLAYQFFEVRWPVYLKILGLGRQFNHDELVEENVHNVRFEFSLVWIFAKGLKLGAIVDLAKVFHQFMKFCLDQGLLTSRQYAVLQRLGNQELITSVTCRNLDQWENAVAYQQKSEEGLTIADKIFTNPNYTISVPKAKKSLATIDTTPVMAFPILNDHPFKLKKELDQHQLDLEMKHVHKLLTTFRKYAAFEPSEADWAIYEAAILQIHHDMVVDYNRRLRQWTMESLEICLVQIYQSNRTLDKKPAFFRLLQLYLYIIEDEGAVKNADALIDGVEHSMSAYIAASTNRLTRY